MSLSIVRVVTDAAGATHFSEVASPAPSLGVSAMLPATATCLMGAPAGWQSAPHPSPSPRWIITLRGTVEVQTTDGEIRQFTTGTAVHLEDTTGAGHATRVVPGDDWLAFVVVE